MLVTTDLKPLSARSAVLSLMLGAPASGLTAAELTALGEHVGIAAATVRVALTRAVAADELRRDGARYTLGRRLLARRAHRDDHTAVVAWDGAWEMAVVVGVGRSAAERAALRGVLAAAHLAELREGVWMRPANLARPAPEDDALQAFVVRPDDVEQITATLWDLAGWAGAARAAVALLDTTSEPGSRLAVAAHLVRHLDTDPLLPAVLLPADWPGDAARAAYRTYQLDLLDAGRNR